MDHCWPLSTYLHKWKVPRGLGNIWILLTNRVKGVRLDLSLSSDSGANCALRRRPPFSASWSCSSELQKHDHVLTLCCCVKTCTTSAWITRINVADCSSLMAGIRSSDTNPELRPRKLWGSDWGGRQTKSAVRGWNWRTHFGNWSCRVCHFSTLITCSHPVDWKSFLFQIRTASRTNQLHVHCVPLWCTRNAKIMNDGEQRVARLESASCPGRAPWWPSAQNIDISLFPAFVVSHVTNDVIIVRDWRIATYRTATRRVVTSRDPSWSQDGIKSDSNRFVSAMPRQVFNGIAMSVKTSLTLETCSTTARRGDSDPPAGVHQGAHRRQIVGQVHQDVQDRWARSDLAKSRGSDCRRSRNAGRDRHVQSELLGEAVRGLTCCPVPGGDS